MNLNGTTLNGLAVVNNTTRRNPIALRRKELQLNQDELANWTGLTKQYIQRVEQGTITRLSHSFMNSLCSGSTQRELNIAIDALECSYLDWQNHVRSSNMLYVRNILVGGHINDSPWSGSWLELRKAISSSKMGFCKLYCIHPGVLDNFERRDNRVALTPYMSTVLLSGGLEGELVELLEDRMRGFGSA